MRRFCLLTYLGVLFAFSSLSARPSNHEELEFPPEMKFKVDFWKAIYTRYTTKQGLLHDAEDLSVIYEAIELPRNGSTASADELRYVIRERLFNIVRRSGQNLTPEERKLLSRFPPGTTRARLIQATENIRFQLGQSDRFKQGLYRSGYYLKHIEKILAEQGVPDFIKYLPHVESSFQENAISKFGAAGLWQLMESTGRIFNLRINYSIDERLDPWLATVAAAKHLARDYKSLGRWPLAFTAYNHGPGGVRQAMRTLGTSDIAEIAFRYSSPSFGFASRNFYAQYLAAVEVASNYQKYFGEDFKIAPTLQFDSMSMKKPTYLRELQRNYQFTMEEFRRLNPSLRSPVIENNRPIPEGTLVRVPPNSKKSTPILVASIERKPAVAKKSEAPRLEIKRAPEMKTPPPVPVATGTMPYRVMDFRDAKGWVKVEINETVTQIAEWLGVDVSKIREWNGLEGDEQARLGQKLLLHFQDKGPQEFEISRKDYHQKIREDFFARFEVAQLMDYEVRQGENLWSLCYQKFDIPPWLLQDYNVKVSVSDLSAGMKLKIPVLKDKDMGVASSVNGGL